MEAVKPQSVYIWGLFNSKEITIPQKMKQLQNKGIIKVCSGGHFYLALSSNGQMYGWGTTKYHRFGISGQDLTVPKLIPLKVQVKTMSAGNWHSLAIDSNGKIYATGHNKQGACGVGHFNNIQTYSEIKSQVIGKSVSCGDCFSLVISHEDDLYSCGHGQLHGHKKKDHINVLTKLKMEDEKITNVSAGFTHALAVTTKGQVFSWGSGNFYQLGHGNKNDEKQPKLVKKLSQIKIKQVSCTRGQKNAHSMAVSQDGIVYTWGAGYKGKLGHEKQWTHQNQADEPEPRKLQTVNCKITKVSAGGIHSNVLNQNGQVMSFGCGSDGRLGHSKSNEYVYLYRQGIPKELDTLKGVVVTDLESSYYHNICLGQKRQ